jgi:arabinose-5-phosphate isomerase
MRDAAQRSSKGGTMTQPQPAACAEPGRRNANEADASDSARRTLSIEMEGLQALGAAIDGPLGEAFARAVGIVRRSSGRVIVTGMGKSGHIGQKIAATLASTGTPAFFVHPSEASHGDLGMIAHEDVVLALSWSGETVELKNLILYSRRFAVPLIALTSNAQSALGKAAEVVLELPRVVEACPHGLAPTTSPMLQLALGDALAVALLESKGFTANDFKVFHPGGQLGANLKQVGEIMHTGDRMPLVGANVVMAEALVTMTEKSFGCLGVVNEAGALIGIITDGDLRRHMGPDLLTAVTGAIMTKAPNIKVVPREMLASAALQFINASRKTVLFVVEDNRPVGVIHVHDLLRAGVT